VAESVVINRFEKLENLFFFEKKRKKNCNRKKMA